MTSIEEVLLNRYGPLLGIAHLAELLHRSPDGLRMALHVGGEYADRLNAAKVRIGRRVYFRTPEVARVLGGVDDAAH